MRSLFSLFIQICIYFSIIYLHVCDYLCISSNCYHIIYGSICYFHILVSDILHHKCFYTKNVFVIHRLVHLFYCISLTCLSLFMNFYKLYANLFMVRLDFNILVRDLFTSSFSVQSACIKQEIVFYSFILLTLFAFYLTFKIFLIHSYENIFNIYYSHFPTVHQDRNTPHNNCQSRQ